MNLKLVGVMALACGGAGLIGNGLGETALGLFLWVCAFEVHDFYYVER